MEELAEDFATLAVSSRGGSRMRTSESPRARPKLVSGVDDNNVIATSPQMAKPTELSAVGRGSAGSAAATELRSPFGKCQQREFAGDRPRSAAHVKALKDIYDYYNAPGDEKGSSDDEDMDAALTDDEVPLYERGNVKEASRTLMEPSLCALYHGRECLEVAIGVATLMKLRRPADCNPCRRRSLVSEAESVAAEALVAFRDAAVRTDLPLSHPAGTETPVDAEAEAPEMSRPDFPEPQGPPALMPALVVQQLQPQQDEDGGAAAPPPASAASPPPPRCVPGTVQVPPLEWSAGGDPQAASRSAAPPSLLTSSPPTSPSRPPLLPVTQHTLGRRASAGDAATSTRTRTNTPKRFHSAHTPRQHLHCTRPPPHGPAPSAATAVAPCDLAATSHASGAPGPSGGPGSGSRSLPAAHQAAPAAAAPAAAAAGAGAGASSASGVKVPLPVDAAAATAVRSSHPSPRVGRAPPASPQQTSPLPPPPPPPASRPPPAPLKAVGVKRKTSQVVEEEVQQGVRRRRVSPAPVPFCIDLTRSDEVQLEWEVVDLTGEDDE